MSTLSVPSVVSNSPRYVTFQANRRGMRTVYDTLANKPVVTVVEDFAYELAGKYNAEAAAKPEPAPVIRTQIVTCPGCHGQHAIPAASFDIWPMCPTCRHSAAWAEARKLMNDVKALRDGTGIFKDLADDERAEQLEQLIGPEMVRFLRSEKLVDVAGVAADEIAVRLGSSDVAPADRTIEAVVEAAPSVDEYAVDSQLRQSIEDQIEDEAREEVYAAEAQDGDRWDGMA